MASQEGVQGYGSNEFLHLMNREAFLDSDVLPRWRGKTQWLVPGRSAVFLVLCTIQGKIIVMKKIDKHKGAQNQSGIIDEDKLRSIQNPFHQAHYGGFTMGMDLTNLIFGLMMFLIGYDYTNPGIIAGFVFSGIFLLVAILSFFLLS